MAYLSPEQITGQVLLNMHVDDNDQIVSTSNTKFDIGFYDFGTKIKDDGKIYSKYAGYAHVKYDTAKLNQLMESVHDFTISCWHALNTNLGGCYSFFNGYIEFDDIPFYTSSENHPNTIEISSNGNKLTNIPAEKDKWMHIAAVSNNGTLSFYANGVRQTGTSTPDYNKNKNNTNAILDDINGFYADDTCIILNQALWTDNFTPPDGPLLGDLKYKTVLYPKFQRLYQNEDKALLKLY